MQKSSSRTANNATNKKLIKLVRDRPAIWDKSDPSYRDKSVKDQEWYTICSLLDPEYNSVDKSTIHETTLATIKRWNNIRDSYVKNLKLQFSSNRPCKPYLYAKLLTFLDPTYHNDSNKTIIKDDNGDYYDNDTSNLGSDILVDVNEASGSNIKLKTEINDECLSESQRNGEDEEPDWNNSVFVDINEDSQGEPVTKKLKKTANNEGQQSTDEVISVLAKLIRREEDEDRSFFTSILPSVKKLTEESKFEFRIQVMKLLKILKIRDGAKNKDVTKEAESD